MYCRNCGNILNPTSVFCPRCGIKIETVETVTLKQQTEAPACQEPIAETIKEPIPAEIELESSSAEEIRPNTAQSVEPSLIYEGGVEKSPSFFQKHKKVIAIAVCIVLVIGAAVPLLYWAFGNDPEDEPRLSDDCQTVLASGYSDNGDYYELVANEEEDYTGVVVKVGVIKNNKWLLEMTSDMPFVDSDGTLYGSSIGGLDTAPDTIFFVGNGCFHYRVEKNSSYRKYEEIIYNVENGKSFELTSDGERGSDYPTYVAYDDLSYISRGRLFGNGTKSNACDDQWVIWQCYDYDYIRDFTKEGIEIVLLNTDTMYTKTLSLGRLGLDPLCHIYSEGLFCVTNNSGMFKFFDSYGNEKLDLSHYQLTHDEQGLFFEDGKCTFTIINNAGNTYTVTVDKSGEVIESKEYKFDNSKLEYK